MALSAQGGPLRIASQQRAVIRAIQTAGESDPSAPEQDEQAFQRDEEPHEDVEHHRHFQHIIFHHLLSVARRTNFVALPFP